LGVLAAATAISKTQSSSFSLNSPVSFPVDI
jgi:hypothetical protein